MTDYSAHDIHRLDQAYPDALADIEHLTGDPARKARLAEVGPEVFAAELTRDLAAATTNPMSLAGWAAIATARLMEAGRVWEEDTEMAWAKVAELTAALAERDTQLTQSRAQAATYANEIGTLTAENARVRQQRDGLIADLTDAGNEVDLLTAANTRFADQLTEAGKHPCNCCFNDGSTIRCGRPATQVIDVPPFGALDVADTCAERINGKPAAVTR